MNAQTADAMPFPFVVGCPRSGTTLLRAMLDSHSQLAIPYESYFIVDLAPRFGPRRFRRFALQKFLAALREHHRFVRWDLPADELDAEFEREQPRTYADAFRTLYAFYARLEGKPRYGDKTPAYVLDVPLLSSIFPESCFVHIIRDGRDVALSLVEMDEWGPKAAAGAGRYWTEYVSAGREAGRALGAKRYREVRYERLVEEPEATLREICAFVGLEYEPTMLEYPERAAALLAPSLQPEIHTRLQQAPTIGLRSWRDQMPEADQAAFMSFAGPLIAELGYAATSTDRDGRSNPV